VSTQPIKRILCPVDFSRSSVDAFNYAASFANKLGAKITLIHVMPSLNTMPISGSARDIDLIETTLMEEKIKREQHLHKLSKRKPLVTQTIIKEGSSYEEIVNFAELEAFDLIVLGATGISEIVETPLGSTALKVARKAQCSVLVVKQKREARIKKILVPTDFSKYASYAFKFAYALQHTFNAKTHLLHVIDYWEYSGKSAQLLNAVKRYLENEAKKLNHEVETRLVINTDIVTAVRDYCKDKKIDLIVMGTRGTSGFKRLLLGSTSEKQLWLSPIPIVITRPKEIE